MLSMYLEARTRRMIRAYRVHDSLPVPIDAVARRMGWEVIYHDRLAPLYGMISCIGGHRRIDVNADIGTPEQRETVGHELGHWIADHLQEGQRKLSCESGVDADELEARAIAAILLIPRRMLETPDLTRADIARLCGVPLDLVHLRMSMF